MNISFDSIGQTAVTFCNNSSAPAKAGDCVCMSANAEVSAAGANKRFFGVALSADDSFAVVQTAGVVSLPFSGTAPSVGWVKLAANGENGVVQDNTNGSEFLVLDVSDSTITFVL
ncbi:MAG: hypothetical protein Q4A39_02020 [Eubacteriales bacterium]|nr:hypothetical protein [Eubacteriales bacterium]